MKKIILSVLMLVAFAAPAQEKAADGAQMVWIKRVTVQNNAAVLAVDYVTMLTGAKAVKAAKLAGEAEFEIGSKGDTVWYVPNDFYIENKSQKLRTLQVAEACVIQLVREGSSRLYKSSLVQLKKDYTDKLYTLVIESGKVIRITEMYTP